MTYSKLSITVLAGGVGGGKFARGVRTLARRKNLNVTVVVNTGDDMWLSGLRICPDLDSVMYTLGGVNDTERGWGRKNESERVSAELRAYDVGWPWFTLGDLDIATHIARTAMLHSGLSLTEVTRKLAERWHLGLALLPATDSEVETLVSIGRAGTRELVHFEEWWVKYRTNVPTFGFIQNGAERSHISDAVDLAIREADAVLLAPSNPVVSIGTIVGIPGARAALSAARGPVIGLSPVIDNKPVRGMADTCCDIVGIECSASGIAEHYSARTTGGLLDGWLVDDVDAAAVQRLAASSIPAATAPLWMHDDYTTSKMVASALELGGISLN